MKYRVISRVIIAFSLILSVWSIITFFSYKRANLYPAIPEEILTVLKENSNTEVVVYNQLLDKFILKYPSLDLTAYNEKFRQTNKLDMHSFLFLTVSGLPDKVKELTENRYKMEKLKSVKGFELYGFQDNYPFDEFLISSSIAKLTVFMFSNNVKKQASFFMQIFNTGPKEWHHIYVSKGSFDNGNMEMINAHPIGGSGSYLEIIVPAQNMKYDKIYFRHAIAISGKCPLCPPVVTEIEQEDKKLTIKTVAYHTEDYELEGFDSDKPLKLKISTENDGKRHFFFDIVYRKEKQ